MRLILAVVHLFWADLVRGELCASVVAGKGDTA